MCRADTERGCGPHGERDDRGDAVSTEYDRIPLAVVGLRISRMHVLTFKELRARYRVVAVCDLDADRAAEVAGWSRA